MAPLIKQLLFATDFSACADRAMGYALSLAGAWKANLCVVTVLELYPGMDPDYTVNKMYLDHLREEANRQLGAVQARAKAASQSVTTRIEVGIPSQALQTVAESTGADLLVVGTHGRTGLDHVLVGSTAERVVRVSPCPVLAVKADKDGAGAVATTAITRVERVTIWANSSGGVMGKMIDAQSIVVASTATRWYGHEGDILRYVFVHSIVLAALVGVLVFLQAYVWPFTLMVP